MPQEDGGCRGTWEPGLPVEVPQLPGETLHLGGGSVCI
jgi:hypothetical protein